MTTNEIVTREILTHHLTAFGYNDVDDIIKDYTEASEVFTQDGILRGLYAIRKFFANYFITIPSGSTFEMKRLDVSDSVAYIVWTSKSEVASIPLGTDTFFLEENKIKYHTVAAHILSK